MGAARTDPAHSDRAVPRDKGLLRQQELLPGLLAEAGSVLLSGAADRGDQRLPLDGFTGHPATPRRGVSRELHARHHACAIGLVAMVHTAAVHRPASRTDDTSIRHVD